MMFILTIIRAKILGKIEVIIVFTIHPVHVKVAESQPKGSTLLY